MSFNSTGRDFEIAIAIAITAFSPTVALATVVGPLIEVPVMLALVWAAMRLRPRLFGGKRADAPAQAQVGRSVTRASQGILIGGPWTAPAPAPTSCVAPCGRPPSAHPPRGPILRR